MQKIFIIGLYKSGTSWLLKCLGSHPAVAAVAELDLIRAVNGREAKTFNALPHDEIIKNIFGQSAFLSLPKSFIDENEAIYKLPAKEMLAILRECRKIDFKQERLPIENFISCLLVSKFQHPVMCHKIAFGGGNSASLGKTISFDDVEDKYLINVINAIRASDNSAMEMMNAIINHIQPMFNDRKVLVLKGADQVSRFELLEQWMPHVKKVAIVRDGRDVGISASHFRSLMREKEAAFVSRDAPVDLRVLLQGWKSRAQMLIDLKDNPNLKIIRYEDLLDNFENSLSDLFAFLGVPTDKKLVTEIKLRNSFRVVTGRRPGMAAKDILRSGIYGEWTSVLSEKQKMEAWETAGQQLEAFGYSRDGRLMPLPSC
ncbi:MAG: hypothetical protein HOP23_11105 [Methylococcaceae bacterium]|nr:hypothetical protein [Methylococcaceae bacterium]